MASTINEVVLQGINHDGFGESIASHFLGSPSFSNSVRTHHYWDGSSVNMLAKDAEKNLKVDVKDKRVYVVVSPRSGDSTDVKINDLYHLFKTTAHSAKKAGAAEIIGIMSYLFYGRSHREVPGEPVFMELLPGELRLAGFSKIMTLAAHNREDTYREFAKAYGVPDGRKVLYSLDPTLIQADIFLNQLRRNGLTGRRIVIGELDKGAVQWTRPYLETLEKLGGIPRSQLSIARFKKERLEPGNPRLTEASLDSYVDLDSRALEGFAETVFVPVDDIADTLSSIYWALLAVHASGRGDPEYVVANLPHALLYKNAPKIVDSLGINLISSTSLPTRRTKEEIKPLPITWYDPTNFFMRAIRGCIGNGQTLDEVFERDYHSLGYVKELYNLVLPEPGTQKQGLLELRKFTPDFSARPLM